MKVAQLATAVVATALLTPSAAGAESLKLAGLYGCAPDMGEYALPPTDYKLTLDSKRTYKLRWITGDGSTSSGRWSTSTRKGVVSVKFSGGELGGLTGRVSKGKISGRAQLRFKSWPHDGGKQRCRR